MARPAVPFGEVDQNAAGVSARGWTEQVFRYCAFTPLFNATGQPAISLPLSKSRDGMPLGVQLAAPMGDERTLLELALELEQASPWPTLAG